MDIAKERQDLKELSYYSERILDGLTVKQREKLSLEKQVQDLQRQKADLERTVQSLQQKNEELNNQYRNFQKQISSVLRDFSMRGDM